MTMRTIAIILCLALMTSCGTERHVAHHGAMKKEGSKSQQNSQQRIASRYGGPNFKKPNQFKRHHFREWWDIF